MLVLFIFSQCCFRFKFGHKRLITKFVLITCFVKCIFSAETVFIQIVYKIMIMQLQLLLSDIHLIIAVIACIVVITKIACIMCGSF